MKKKFFMLMMCAALGVSMLAGCGGNADEDTTLTPPASTDIDGEEIDDSEEIVVVDDEVSEKEDEKTDEEPEIEAIPRSDAYEQFLAGEMEVNVLYEPEDDYEGRRPRTGTYTYEELIEELKEEFYQDFEVKYGLFTPDTGEEGDDVMALYLENSDGSFSSWMGFIAYVDGELVMKYNEYFGYRTYFDLYWDGRILSGGSGGAGALYNQLSYVYPDSSVQSVFKEAYLYSTWCSDVAYILDPDVAFEDVPVLNDASEIQMDVVYDDDGNVKFSVIGWSDNKAVKADEETFVQALEAMGAVQTDSDTIEALTETGVDESKTMTWNHVENVTVSAG